MTFRTAVNNALTNVKSFFSNPQTTDQANVIDSGLQKAFVSNEFLYKPPYGYPRMVDIPTLRLLAKSPYVFMVTSTIIDEVASIDWDIVPKEHTEPTEEESTTYIEEANTEINTTPKEEPLTLAHIKEVKDFFNNPNGNEESFEFLIRAVLRDILEVDSGVFVKVFNKAGKMVQLFCRDGATFLKNPDIHGYLGDRAEFMMPQNFDNENERVMVYETIYKQQAAYFQYGWVSMMPIPFGKREIVYMMKNARSDSIYGRSPLEVLHEILYTLIYGSNYNLDFYTNNNLPEGIIELIGATPDQIKSFRERFEKQFKVTDEYGNNRKQFHKYPISNTPAKFIQFQLKPADMEIIQQQQWFSKLVWACYSITPSELGFTEDSNRAVEMGQSKVTRRKAIKPLLKLLEYHINTQIMPEFGFDDIEFKFDSFDLEEELVRQSLFEIQLRNNVKTINEVREEMGLQPVEGGDKINKMSSFNFTGNFPNQEGNTPTKQEQTPEEAKKPEEEKPTPFEEKSENLKKKDFSSTKQDLTEYFKDRKQLILEELNNLYANNKLIQVKGFSDLWNRLIDNIKKIFTPKILEEIVNHFVKNNYYVGMEEVGKELDLNFFPNEEAIKFLNTYNFELIKNMDDELTNDLRTILQRAYLNDKPFTEVKKEVQEAFNINQDRAEMIVRTEQNRAENFGRIDAATQSGVIQGKTIINYMDEKTSPLCKRMMAKYGDKTISLTARFKDDETGETWICPPFHPRCRTRLVTPRMEGTR